MLSQTSRSDAVLKRLLSLHPKKIDLALDRILRLLNDLGNPQLKLPPVIHVAGTNGKGSACAFVRAMLEAQGLKVHVHTSPQLVRFHERIRLAGELIDEEKLAALLEECERVNGGEPINMPCWVTARPSSSWPVTKLFTNPKSSTFTVSESSEASSITLPGFKSRCTTPS